VAVVSSFSFEPRQVPPVDTPIPALGASERPRHDQRPAPLAQRRGRGFNFSFVKDPELDRFLDAQAREVNDAKRAEIRSRAPRLAMDRAYMLPMYEQDYVYLKSASVRDLSYAIGTFPWIYDVSIVKEATPRAQDRRRG